MVGPYPILERVFDSLESAVRAHRVAAVEHHRARDSADGGGVDYGGMDAASSRIRDVADYLRRIQRPELIHLLTMEWVTEGRDATEHARFRAEVDALVLPEAVETPLPGERSALASPDGRSER